MGLFLATPAALVWAGMARYWFGDGWIGFDFLFLLAIPLGARLGAKWGAVRGDRRWKTFGLLAGSLSIGPFGFVLEGLEGLLIGLPLGLLTGFLLGRFIPWFASALPNRWGVVTGWSLIGATVFLIPMLVALRLLYGRFDDDDSAFILFTIFAGIYYARYREGWQDGVINKALIRKRLLECGRQYLGPRVLPWFIAILVSGLVAGPAIARYDVIRDENLIIRIQAISHLWPASLLIAAIIGFLASLPRKGSLNALYFFGCIVVGFHALMTLVPQFRHHCVVAPQHLHLRYGMWKTLKLEKHQLSRIDTKVARGRRFVIPYPILVTDRGKRHSLLRLPMHQEVETYLTEKWELPPADGR